MATSVEVPCMICAKESIELQLCHEHFDEYQDVRFAAARRVQQAERDLWEASHNLSEITRDAFVSWHAPLDE